MTKEKPLSEKMFSTEGQMGKPYEYVVLQEDVALAVKELKEELKTIDEHLKGGMVPKLGVYNHLLVEIDKIFGDLK